MFIRRSPEACGLQPDGRKEATAEMEEANAMRELLESKGRKCRRCGLTFGHFKLMDDIAV